MRHLLRHILTLSVLCLPLAAPVVAQERLDYELTPFAAYRMGGDFEDDDTGEEFDLDDSSAFGLILNIRAKPQGQWEILYAQQSTEVDTAGTFVATESIDLDVQYFQLGGTYLYDGDRVVPFIALTLGVTHFDPQFADLDSENYFSASFGGGIKMNMTERMGVRLEGRVYSTFLESDSRIFCSSSFGAGECLIQASGTTFNQWEARAGLIFRF